MTIVPDNKSFEKLLLFRFRAAIFDKLKHQAKDLSSLIMQKHNEITAKSLGEGRRDIVRGDHFDSFHIDHTQTSYNCKISTKAKK